MPNLNHLQNETNSLDPDDGISWLCTACNLPIFATPFSGGDDGIPLLHDQCSNLPAVLHYCELHPKQPLFLRDSNSDSDETCSECSQKCGSKLYYCQDTGCGLVLDVACALPVKILHRSHRHRLIAVRGGSTNKICGVCGVSHSTTAAAGARSYSCSVCAFWIHSDCATSAYVIEHVKHDHPLVLYYDVGATFGAQYSTPLDVDGFLSRPAPKNDNHCSRCAICRNDVGEGAGIYACITCRDGIFHIYCATSDPRSFKHVLSREARFPGLVHLPMKDEHQSIVGYLRNATSNNNDDEQIGKVKYRTNLEERLEPFKLHINPDDEDGCRVCDACLKIIDTPPFYSSSVKPNVLLHDYCYLLIPRLLSSNPAHTPGHNFLFLLANNPDELHEGSSCCAHCGCRWFRGFYCCFTCPWRLQMYALDVSCALMPNVVTHEAHSTAHFLRLSEHESSRRSQGGDPDCACCLRPLGKLAFECRTCENFAIHTWCAMLPKTVAHKFDPHPLRLTTTTCVADICEICEGEIEEKVWRYSCEICDQSFHVDCIPSLDMNYKIKSLISEGVRLRNVPKRLIRGLTLQGHGHGKEYCRDVADEYDDVWESDY